MCSAICSAKRSPQNTIESNATRTHDERATLFLIRPRQPAHGLEDLDARVVVDEDRVRVFLAVNEYASVVGPYASVIDSLRCDELE